MKYTILVTRLNIQWVHITIHLENVCKLSKLYCRQNFDIAIEDTINAIDQGKVLIDYKNKTIKNKKLRSIQYECTGAKLKELEIFVRDILRTVLYKIS
jgi:hypothetical protein